MLRLSLEPQPAIVGQHLAPMASATCITFAMVFNLAFAITLMANRIYISSGGGDYKNAPRGKSTWSIPNAAKIAQRSTEIAIARWNAWDAGTGDISESNAASSYPIPNPATVNFANPSHLNPDTTSRGSCVAVTVTSIVGGSSCASGCKRFTCLPPPLLIWIILNM